MKQAVIKLKNSQVSSLVYHPLFRSTLLNGIFVSLGVLSLCYVLVIGSIIFNIVERKALEGEAKVLSAEVSTLELSYLSSYQKFDDSLGRELGFIEIKPSFATRTPLGMNQVKYENAKLVRNEI